MVGLEFWVRFRRPIYADATTRLECASPLRLLATLCEC
jgi:hypothetical protein